MNTGDALGPYRILRPLGEGGMGAVYIAQHSLLNRNVAIKVLRKDRSVTTDMVQRFFTEAKLLTAVTDPGVVQVFDYGWHGDRAYIVMELLVGETLDDRLARRGALGALEAVRLTRMLALSLAATHDRSIIHRDLKPANLYVVRDPALPGEERPKVLDFGIAKLFDATGSSPRTRTGTFMGTPMFMSPEQAAARGTVDHRTDIYSLGAVFYSMLTFRPPFPGRTWAELVMAHLEAPPPVPSEAVASVPPAVDAIVARCLEKQPARRYQSMQELAAALKQVERALTPRTWYGAAAPTATEIGAPRRRRSGVALMALALAAVLGAIGGVVISRARSRSSSGQAGSADAARATAATASATAALEAGVSVDAAAAVATTTLDAGAAVTTTFDAGAAVTTTFDAGAVDAGALPDGRGAGHHDRSRRGQPADAPARDGGAPPTSTPPQGSPDNLLRPGD